MFSASMLPVWDLDATQSASYSGSGTTWHNLVTNPADGSSQSTYDFTIHGTPTFTGGAGTSGAYFAMDGASYFEIAGGNTQFIKDMHKVFPDPVQTYGTVNSFTLILAFRTDAGPTAADLMGTEAGLTAPIANDFGFTVVLNGPVYSGPSNQIGFAQYGGSTGPGGQYGNFVPAASTNYFVTISNGNYFVLGCLPFIAVNSRSLNSNPSGFGTSVIFTTTTDPTGTFRFASAGDGTPVATGTRIYGCYAFAKCLTNDELSSFVDTINARQGNRWSF